MHDRVGLHAGLAPQQPAVSLSGALANANAGRQARCGLQRASSDGRKARRHVIRELLDRTAAVTNPRPIALGTKVQTYPGLCASTTVAGRPRPRAAGSHDCWIVSTTRRGLRSRQSWLLTHGVRLQCECRGPMFRPFCWIPSATLGSAPPGASGLGVLPSQELQRTQHRAQLSAAAGRACMTLIRKAALCASHQLSCRQDVRMSGGSFRWFFCGY